MKKIIIQLDQFGCQQKLQLHSNSFEQRSIFGGIMTIILYSLSLAFFIYELVDWQSNNKLPKITQISAQINEYEEQKSDGDIIEYGFDMSAPSSINPFDPENLILIPIVESSTNDKIHTRIQLESKMVENFGISNYRFVLSEFHLKTSLPTSKNNVYQDYEVSIKQCSNQYLSLNQKCANDSFIHQFFEQQSNRIIIKTYISQFNPKQRKLEKLPKILFLNIQQDYEQSTEFDMKLTQANIDSGILFPSESIYQYFSGYNLVQSQIGREQSNLLWNETRYATLYYTIAFEKQKMWVEFPKIAEILADSGSIITWILQISFFVYKYNESQLNVFTIEEVLKTYYRDFTKFTIQKNWLGKYKSIQLNGKIYDSEKFSSYYTQLSKVAEAKCNFMNLLYELSRVQFLLQTCMIGQQNNLSREMKLAQIHQMGINMESKLDELGFKVEQQIPNDIKINPMSQGFSLEELHPQDVANSGDDAEQLQVTEDQFTLFMKQESIERIKLQSQQAGVPKEEVKSFYQQTSIQQ